MLIYQYMSIILVPKSSEKFWCDSCDYKTSRQSQYDRHLLTTKHLRQQISTNINNLYQKSSKSYVCKNCNKEYKDNSGLWRHNKTCNVKVFDNEPTDKELIMMLIKENTEVKNMMKEQQNLIMTIIANGTHNTITTNNTNSHNKAFNLNFFLNETCKDAMNITEFVDSIKLQLSDLENVGKLGYVEGISNIIVKNLNDLDVTERPIHCTDKKREVLYVKDDNKWEKEDEEKKKIKTVIKKVANKNIRLIQKFKEVHPDCGKSTSKFSDQYDKIIVESMGGSGNNDAEKEEKIIQRISKNVTIDKI